MRKLFLRDALRQSGCVIGERYGNEVVVEVADRETEYRHVRERAALTDFSFMQVFRFPEDPGVDVLDSLLAGNVARVRFGRLLHTFLADEGGHLVADCYVANNDEEFFLLCESVVPDADLHAVLAAAGVEAAGMEDLTSTHVLFGVDGFKSYAVVQDLFGAEVLGLPYLSVEVYEFEGAQVHLFRAGKTSEFGYLISAPRSVARALYDRLLEGVRDQGGDVVGVQVHDELRLEGRFFNIHAEGLRVRDPLVLGLQWMVDLEKDTFRGSEPLLARRAAGVGEKLVGLALPAGAPRPALDTPILLEGEVVGRIVATCMSHVLGHPMALGVLRRDVAWSGLGFDVGAPGQPIRTISMPPIIPKSLTVKLDEL